MSVAPGRLPGQQLGRLARCRHRGRAWPQRQQRLGRAVAQHRAGHLGRVGLAVSLRGAGPASAGRIGRIGSFSASGQPPL